MKLDDINPGNCLTGKELYSELWKAESGSCVIVKVGNENLVVVGWDWIKGHLVLKAKNVAPNRGT